MIIVDFPDSFPFSGVQLCGREVWWSLWSWEWGIVFRISVDSVSFIKSNGRGIFRWFGDCGWAFGDNSWFVCLFWCLRWLRRSWKLWKFFFVTDWRSHRGPCLESSNKDIFLSNSSGKLPLCFFVMKFDYELM